MPEQTAAHSDAVSAVVACDFKRNGTLSESQLRVLTTLNEGLARHVSLALGGYLRTSIECKLLSIEQIAYRDVVARITPPAYVAILTADHNDSRSLLQLDLGLAFPIIDLLLGGEGKPERNIREMTEVEEQVLEMATLVICRELKAAWQPLAANFDFEQRQALGRLNTIMPPEERTLVTSFDLALPDGVNGRMMLVYANCLTNAMRRHLESETEYHGPIGESGRERLRELLMDGSFVFELSLPELMVPATELVGLSVGDVVRLGCNTQKSATASIEGIPLFAASAARSGTHRAAQVVQVHSLQPARDQRSRYGSR